MFLLSKLETDTIPIFVPIISLQLQSQLVSVSMSRRYRHHALTPNLVVARFQNVNLTVATRKCSVLKPTGSVGVSTKMDVKFPGRDKVENQTVRYKVWKQK